MVIDFEFWRLEQYMLVSSVPSAFNRLKI